MENYKMDPDRSMCINIEDIYEAFSRLKYKISDTKYVDWDHYRWVLINS